MLLTIVHKLVYIYNTIRVLGAVLVGEIHKSTNVVVLQIFGAMHDNCSRLMFVVTIPDIIGISGVAL